MAWANREASVTTRTVTRVVNGSAPPPAPPEGDAAEGEQPPAPQPEPVEEQVEEEVVIEAQNVIATGGMDDAVRVWDVTADGDLFLRHKLVDHSLGVVSVDINKDVSRKCFLNFYI